VSPLSGTYNQLLRHPFTSDATAEAWLKHKSYNQKDSSAEEFAKYLRTPLERDAWSFAEEFDWVSDETMWLLKQPQFAPVYLGSWELLYVE
jgi:hypothetical protein